MLDSFGNDCVVGRLNWIFIFVGFYVILVEVKNNVSMVNIIILVYIIDFLFDFNVFLVFNLLYLGVLIKFNVFVSGLNVKFKWLFGDGLSIFYVFNKFVIYRFLKKGILNVIVIVNNLVFLKEIYLIVIVFFFFIVIVLL